MSSGGPHGLGLLRNPGKATARGRSTTPVTGRSSAKSWLPAALRQDSAQGQRQASLEPHRGGSAAPWGGDKGQPAWPRRIQSPTDARWQQGPGEVASLSCWTGCCSDVSLGQPRLPPAVKRGVPGSELWIKGFLNFPFVNPMKPHLSLKPGRLDFASLVPREFQH